MNELVLARAKINQLTNTTLPEAYQHWQQAHEALRRANSIYRARNRPSVILRVKLWFAKTNHYLAYRQHSSIRAEIARLRNLEGDLASRSRPTLPETD